MTIATWKIIRRGAVPEDANVIEFGCPACGREALLPIVGIPLAQSGGGVVFDGESAMPLEIQCRKCRKRFEVC